MRENCLVAEVPPEVFSPSRLSAVARSGLLDTGPEEPFDRLARLAATLLSAASAFVTIVDERRSFWKSCIGVPAQNGARETRVEESFCQYVIGTGEPLVVGDAKVDPLTRDNPSVTSMGVAAWAGYPVRGPDGEVLGTFCVVDTVSREWSTRDLEILETLAHAASGEVALRIAVGEARAAWKRAEEHAERAEALAQTLQESLLPARLPQIPQVELAARYRPGGRGVEVLGDFYDVFPVPDGWGVVIGDVCGKGAQAARTTALARSTVRAIAHSGGRPAAVLAALNDVLLDWFAGKVSFVTATYATVRVSARGLVVTLARGGHPPALVRRSDGSVSEFGLPGMLLGCRPEVATPEQQIILPPGWSLVLYTDGVTEARLAGGELYGEERLRALISELPPEASAECIATAVEEASLTFAGGLASDDTAIMVLRTL